MTTIHSPEPAPAVLSEHDQRADGLAMTDTIVGRLFGVGIVLHLLLRSTDDRLHDVVLDAIDQLDQAIVDVRRAHG